MGSIVQLGYIVLAVSDLPEWEHFAVDMMGLQAGKRDAGSVSLRMDEYTQRIVLTKGEQDDLAVVGWELASEADLLDYVERLNGMGVQLMRGDPELAHRRDVQDIFVGTDPNGVTLEFYWGPALAAEPFKSSVLTSSFLAGSRGMGHVLLAVAAKEATDDFYQRILGMKLSDCIREEIAPGMVIDATFLHVNPRHHSLAYAPLPPVKRIHHIMIEVSDIDDVGLAYDRCLAAGLPIEMGLGKHSNDQMFSFYVRTPSGFSIEYGWGGIEIDDSTWKAKTYSQLSNWGHSRVPA